MDPGTVALATWGVDKLFGGSKTPSVPAEQQWTQRQGARNMDILNPLMLGSTFKLGSEVFGPQAMTNYAMSMPMNKAFRVMGYQPQGAWDNLSWRIKDNMDITDKTPKFSSYGGAGGGGGQSVVDNGPGTSGYSQSILNQSLRLSNPSMRAASKTIYNNLIQRGYSPEQAKTAAAQWYTNKTADAKLTGEADWRTNQMDILYRLAGLVSPYTPTPQSTQGMYQDALAGQQYQDSQESNTANSLANLMYTYGMNSARKNPLVPAQTGGVSGGYTGSPMGNYFQQMYAGGLNG